MDTHGGLPLNKQKQRKSILSLGGNKEEVREVLVGKEGEEPAIGK